MRSVGEILRSHATIPRAIPFDYESRAPVSEGPPWWVSRARRTAAGPHLGAIADARCPPMCRVTGAAPPNLSFGGPGDVLGQQRAVPRTIPFPSEIGKRRRERVRPRYPVVRAERAARAVPPAICQTGAPDVLRIRCALPPETLVRPGDDPIGGECAVLRRMPLTSYVRCDRRETVGHGRATVSAERAPARARRPVRRRRGPLVVRALPTLPPYSRIRAIADFVRKEVPVLRGMPLGKKPGVARDPVLGSVPAHPSRSRLGSRPVEDPAGQQRRELAHRPPAWISDPASTQGLAHGRLWHAHERGYSREAGGATHSPCDTRIERRSPRRLRGCLSRCPGSHWF